MYRLQVPSVRQGQSYVTIPQQNGKVPSQFWCAVSSTHPLHPLSRFSYPNLNADSLDRPTVRPKPRLGDITDPKILVAIAPIQL